MAGLGLDLRGRRRIGVGGGVRLLGGAGGGDGRHDGRGAHGRAEGEAAAEAHGTRGVERLVHVRRRRPVCGLDGHRARAHRHVCDYPLVRVIGVLLN